MSLMDGLSGWLKQIVAAVLLASLVDLLLPNRTMQRYVRLVAGLFVLLTVATPLLKWMQSDFSGKLAAELDAAARPNVNSQEQLSRIQEEGGKLRKRQNEAAADLAALRMAEAMKADIEETQKRRVRKVDVRMGTQPDGSVSVRTVTVSLEAPVAKDGSEGSSKAMKPIAQVMPVAPVTVEIRGQRDSVDASAAPERTNEAGPDRSTRLRIAAFLSARYGVPAESVVVTETAPN